MYIIELLFFVNAIMALIVASNGLCYRSIAGGATGPWRRATNCDDENWFMHKGQFYQLRQIFNNDYSICIVSKTKHDEIIRVPFDGACVIDYASTSFVSSIKMVLCDGYYAGAILVADSVHIVRVDIAARKITLSNKLCLPKLVHPMQRGNYLFVSYDAAMQRLHVFVPEYDDGALVLFDINGDCTPIRAEYVVSKMCTSAYNGILYVYQYDGGYTSYDIASGQLIDRVTDKYLRWPAGGSLVSYMRAVDKNVYEVIIVDLRTGDEYVIDTISETLVNTINWTIMSQATI